jgi:hypothetical protein
LMLGPKLGEVLAEEVGDRGLMLIFQTVHELP